MAAQKVDAVKKFDCINDVWDDLIDFGLFTEAELKLVTDVAGYSIKTLNNCIYSRYGYRDLKQFVESEKLLFLRGGGYD